MKHTLSKERSVLHYEEIGSQIYALQGDLFNTFAKLEIGARSGLCQGLHVSEASIQTHEGNALSRIFGNILRKGSILIPRESARSRGRILHELVHREYARLNEPNREILADAIVLAHPYVHFTKSSQRKFFEFFDEVLRESPSEFCAYSTGPQNGIAKMLTPAILALPTLNQRASRIYDAMIRHAEEGLRHVKTLDMGK